ncbi:MAG: 50S ribosomal protein L30 [Acidimicrobiia bacterium]
MGKLIITQTKSTIGAKPKTRATMRALGLTRIGRTRIHEDNAVVRGMIARVPHLIDVKEQS